LPAVIEDTVCRQTKVVRRENQNTHFVFSNFFCRKLCRLLRQCGKIW